ncbi:MAG TPA: hypothetical protein DDZ81_23115 [Acetobacteraceae bacterium]|jgi:diguanylate cyclase (GGDEF)-like protein|nr:hypothetical protein [Acetobacteraceae bacterium]
MTDTILEPPVMVQPSGDASRDLVREAHVESRQRWRQFVSLAADLAFETDVKGRFVFMTPETALGWPAGSLIGQPSELLVGDDGTGATFNPFRPAAEVRRHRAWLRSSNGGLEMMSISAVPLFDASGAIVGARGVGLDMTDTDAQTSHIAGRLRRGEVLDHILSRVGQESGADAMMDAALWALIQALGAEGAAVIGAMTDDGPVDIIHECGPGASAVLPSAVRLVAQPGDEPGQATTPQGRFVLAVRCRTRFGTKGGLTIWRNAAGRQWDQQDTLLTASAVAVVRMILEYEAVQREMAHQARTDPLTGLLNRRAFMEEMRRHIARLDRETEAGTLMYVDLDAFKAVNDQLGHAMGDKVLVHLADMLRRMVRPSDLVARLGGDEFAVWLSGADRMTAAERADQLCKAANLELPALLPDEVSALGVSVGIAMRGAGSRESIEDLTRRADMAMYEVKRGGRRHWRVSLLDGEG